MAREGDVRRHPPGPPRAYGDGVVDHDASEPDYLVANRANWDDRAVIHASSPDYEVRAFVDDPEFLSGVVRFDLPRLGDIRGLDGVHLQCHIGTDTISVARLGARMTGLDLSPQSVAEARALATAAGADIDYVVSDVYDAPAALGGRTFDLVYVSLGAISWLPSVDRWAEVVDAVLRPGGRLFIRDTHPMLDTMEPDPVTGRPVPQWPYFEHPDPVVFQENVTYVRPADDNTHEITHTEAHTWSHGIGETVTAVLRRGMILTLLEEHDSVPFCPFPGIMTRSEPGEWRLTEHPERMAMSFTLSAHKPG
jgi:SAM-dependent methyltransferase